MVLPFFAGTDALRRGIIFASAPAEAVRGSYSDSLYSPPLNPPPPSPPFPPPPLPPPTLPRPPPLRVI